MRKHRVLVLLSMFLLALCPHGLVGQRPTATSGKKTAPRVYDRGVQSAFFRNVLEEVGPGQPGAVRAAPAATGVAGNPATGGGESQGAGGGWKAIISPETLEAEVKSSVLAVGEPVQSKGKFNTGHRAVETIYSTLAVVFGIIANYDGDVRFKEKAAGMRDAIAKSGSNCKVNSDGAFNEAKLRLQDLQELVRGGNVSVPDGAEPTVPFKNLAHRPTLMKRMKEALRDKLAPMTSSAGEFKSNKDKVLHEAELLAALAKVIQDPSYDFADDEGYLGFAKELQKQSREAVEAVKLDSAQRAQAAIGAAGKACDNCHGDFR